MSKNKDNGIKSGHGKEAKDRTRRALENCESICTMAAGVDRSRNNIEKATCDLEVTLKNHSSTIYITSTWSLRKDRMAAANTILQRLKSRTPDTQSIAILSSPFMEEHPAGNNHVLSDAYNFGDREDIGIDFVVKTEDISEVMDVMNGVEDKNDVAAMKKAALECIKKKNY